MQGLLSEQPLAELIREIASKGLSGRMRLEHDRAQTAAYFENGQLIYAAANLRTLRLREYLCTRGLIADAERAGLKNNLSDLALAASLTSSGKLRQQDVDALFAILVSDVLRVALLWTEGTWEFDLKARLEDAIRVEVDIDTLLREAAQRMPVDFVSGRFRNPTESINRANEVPRTSNFMPAESFLLSRLDTPMGLEDLLACSGLPESEARRLIYGLALSGFITRENWQNAFRTEHVKASQQISARVAFQNAASEAQPANSRWHSASDEEEDLEKFLLRLSEATNYYEIMELRETAGANEIKDAYYALARRYHPNRFHLQFGTPLHGKLSSAFARITQAYERLTDPSARSAYDKALERSRRLSDSATSLAPSESGYDPADESKFKTGDAGTDTARAEHNFREGIAAQKEGRLDAAISFLAAAARLAPEEARYRAYYGRALAAVEKTRRLAENEIMAAVQLDPASANFRAMLAELYFQLKFTRRAQTEVEKALSLDANNALALALLRKLENSRKVG